MVEVTGLNNFEVFKKCSFWAKWGDALNTIQDELDEINGDKIAQEDISEEDESPFDAEFLTLVFNQRLKFKSSDGGKNV